MLRATLLAVALCLSVPATASAFDTGPHGDMTHDAMRAEGANVDAADVARINNWFVDMYANAGSYPYSGHADVLKVVLGGAIGNSENWSKTVVKSATALHMDSGIPGSDTVAGLEAEWQRLRHATYNAILTARVHKNPQEVLTVVGASLHAVQDFYAHTNFSEPAGTGRFSAPGWDSLNEGLTPTWFDVPKAVRDVSPISANAKPDDPAVKAGTKRKHGGFKTSYETSMNKDDPGRPNFTNAYMSAYFATRQWIRALRVWLADDALWNAAMNWRTQIRALDYDFNGMIKMSTYSGHLYGAGEPWAPGNKENRGWSGSLVALRSVTQSYFEDRGRTVYRKLFEKVVPTLGGVGVATDEQTPIQSSRPLQAATRFVRLQIPYMRGIDLGDIGPDDADMYSRATINGQNYVSTIIQAHDRFSFGKPYHPFTFIKAVPSNLVQDEPIREITVKIRTSKARFSGTDDDIYLRISGKQRFQLDRRLWDDFERGDDTQYSVPIDAAARKGLKYGDIQYLQIEKSRDGVAGGYKLAGVTIRINGQIVVAQGGIEKWLENNRRTWRAPGFAAGPRVGPKVPVWFDLWEDDLRIYGVDDRGDINPYDARNAMVRGYVPGSVDKGQSTGGKIYGGRLNNGGDKATVKWSIETLDTFLPAAPDLVITELDSLKFTVKNQGTGPAGPFSVKVNAMFVPFEGLAPGQAATYEYGSVCLTESHATADISNQVIESNETNNSLDFNNICIV